MIPDMVIAKDILNINGIVITEEEYNNFIKVHSHDYIMTMNEEQYNKLASLDYSNVISTKKYVLSTYNPSLNLTTEREITENEYNAFEREGNTRLNSGSVTAETNAKILVMGFVANSYWHYATLTATWKYMPSVREYDVIGFYGDGFTIREGSQAGQQMYTDANYNYQVINYAWNGTNIKKFTNGYGISMNLVNPTIHSLSLDTACDLRADVTNPVLFGSYQHAVDSSITLTQSKNYTLGSGGLGGVFVYPYNISAKYDGMSGVILTF